MKQSYFGKTVVNVELQGLGDKMIYNMRHYTFVSLPRFYLAVYSVIAINLLPLGIIDHCWQKITTQRLYYTTQLYFI